MNTYLITGATGYIGSMMAEKLVSEGHHVILLVRSPEKLKVFLRQKTGIVVGDVCDAAVWDTIGANVDYVIHCAAPTGSADTAAKLKEKYDLSDAEAEENMTFKLIYYLKKNKI